MRATSRTRCLRLCGQHIAAMEGLRARVACRLDLSAATDSVSFLWYRGYSHVISASILGATPFLRLGDWVSSCVSCMSLDDCALSAPVESIMIAFLRDGVLDFIVK